MQENSASDPSTKRHTPPVRNRLLNRRKSGDSFDRINNSQGSDGERGSSSINHQSESSNSGFIVVDGCSGSEAVQLMIERWAAAMDSHNDPSIGIMDKPVIYSGSGGSAWGSIKLPHQMDFLTELRNAIQTANAHTPNTAELSKSRALPSGRI